MQPIYLFDLASKNNSWLSSRQTLAAANIANVNTPGYKARDLRSFESVLESTGLGMAATQPGHMEPSADSLSASAEAKAEKSWDVFHSGGNVSVEQELMKSGEIRRGFSLNTNIVTSFHRMLLSSSRASGG
jgi:flagellar basal-body rod protein FlgB